MDRLLVLALLCLWGGQVGAEALPEYKSTDNTGMGRQERFEAIEKYLMEVAKYSQKLETRLGENQKIVALEEEQKKLKAEIDKLKEDNRLLRQDLVYVRQAIGNLSQVDFERIQNFVEKLDGGEWEKMQQEVEGVKLTMRSLEALIQTMQQNSSR